MASQTPQEINAEIMSRLDVAGEYAALGVQVSGSPRSSGMVSCYAFGREDRKPSAWINIKTGYYGDSGGKNVAAYSCSLFDFAANAGKFADWKAARKAYAEKAGITIGRTKQSNRGETNWRTRIEFQSWETPGNEMLAQGWCLHKPGVTLESIKAAGGQLAYYPCYVDKKTKKLKRTHNVRQVVAFPCYGEWFLDADPVAWQVFDTSGQPIDVTPPDVRKAGGDRRYAKNVSVGPTHGTLCGLSSLIMLLDEERRKEIKLVWKVEGIPDLLSLMGAIPEDQREYIAVVTSPAGATAEIVSHQVKLLAGLPVAVVGDADEAGQVGVEKWCRALHGVAAEARVAKLPYEIQPKSGKDVRDFLIGA